MVSIKIFFLAVLIARGFCDITVGELPSDVKAEFLAILDGTLEFTGQCPAPQEAQINFLLYTRNNPNDPITLNISNPQIDPTKKVVMVIHGWTSGPTDYGIPELKDAYLQRYDCSVIILDWSSIAWQPYTTAYCEIPQIGQIGANFLCALKNQLQILLSTVHISGHSMGAHISGYIGTNTVSTCGQTVGRITGLDPAGPIYSTLGSGLVTTSAGFVDIIHTNAMELGYYGNIGDVDFQVNCGGPLLQPGCPTVDPASLNNTLLQVVACSHLRSLDLMAESMNSDQFKAKSCKSCPNICLADLVNPTFTIMGEDCPENPPSPVYWIPTYATSPFAEGCTPYPIGC